MQNSHKYIGRVWVPPTKREMISWLMDWTKSSGYNWKACQLRSMTYSQLKAVFWKIRYGEIKPISGGREKCL